jgi:nucleoside-triphosphatase THEP1
MTTPAIGAIVYAEGEGPRVDHLLAEVSRALRRDGTRLAGAVQHNTDRADRCRCDMTLEDLSSGRLVGISEKRGPQSRGCRLDSFALEEVVGLVGGSLASEPDLVIVNRFGKREADGAGFRPVIEDALARGVAVLVAVSRGNVAAWDDFAGALDLKLDVDVASVLAWSIEAARSSPRDMAAPRSASV